MLHMVVDTTGWEKDWLKGMNEYYGTNNTDLGQFSEAQTGKYHYEKYGQNEGRNNTYTSGPGTGTTNPGTGTTNPGTGTANPGTGTANPGTGTTNPGTGTTNPGTGTTTSWNRWKRSNGTRP